jgi:thiamine biosynthesis protein ThiI
MVFSAEAGGVILDNCPNAVVDLHNPDTVVEIDIRENGFTYISTQSIDCAGGMPVGTAGRGLLLLSGGIDSPVAGYYMARRGMTVNALHFHSFPYTSELARQKVISLAKLMSKYLGPIKLHFVSFTQVQEAINRHCDRDYMITIMRRIMMRIATRLSKDIGAGAIITGESLGQVASQTLESITSTSAVTSLPIGGLTVKGSASFYADYTPFGRSCQGWQERFRWANPQKALAQSDKMCYLSIRRCPRRLAPNRGTSFWPPVHRKGGGLYGDIS